MLSRATDIRPWTLDVIVLEPVVVIELDIVLESVEGTVELALEVAETVPELEPVVDIVLLMLLTPVEVTELETELLGLVVADDVTVVDPDVDMDVIAVEDAVLEAVLVSDDDTVEVPDEVRLDDIVDETDELTEDVCDEVADVNTVVEIVLDNVVIGVPDCVDDAVELPVEVRVVDGEVTSQFRKNCPEPCRSIKVFRATARDCIVWLAWALLPSSPRYSCGRRELPVIHARSNLYPSLPPINCVISSNKLWSAVAKELHSASPPDAMMNAHRVGSPASLKSSLQASSPTPNRWVQSGRANTAFSTSTCRSHSTCL